MCNIFYIIALYDFFFLDDFYLIIIFGGNKIFIIKLYLYNNIYVTVAYIGGGPPRPGPIVKFQIQLKHLMHFAKLYIYMIPWPVPTIIIVVLC
jgi:hypothetical protein